MPILLLQRAAASLLTNCNASVHSTWFLLSATRAASSSSRKGGSGGRGGRKHPSHVKGYDRLLQQWAHMTAKPSASSSTSSSGSKGKANAQRYGECLVFQTQNGSRQGCRNSQLLSGTHIW